MDGLCDASASERALVYWWRPADKSEWQFCAHHSREFERIMLDSRHLIARDDRAQLTARAEVPA